MDMDARRLTPVQRRRERLRRQARKMRAKGWTFARIGERLEIGAKTAWRYAEGGDG